MEQELQLFKQKYTRIPIYTEIAKLEKMSQFKGLKLKKQNTVIEP